MTLLLALVGGGAPPTVTGTIAATEAADTSAIVAGHGPSGTSATTEAADTSSITAGHGPSGTIAATDAADTSSITAGHGPAGSIAAVDDNDTANATGTHTPPVTPPAQGGFSWAATLPKPAIVVGRIRATEQDDSPTASGVVSAPLFALSDEDFATLLGLSLI